MSGLEEIRSPVGEACSLGSCQGPGCPGAGASQTSHNLSYRTKVPFSLRGTSDLKILQNLLHLTFRRMLNLLRRQEYAGGSNKTMEAMAQGPSLHLLRAQTGTTIFPYD